MGFKLEIFTCSWVLRINKYFYLQLEKEALVKGVPIGQAIDIEIPPPRPKRKPSNPYPRKTGVAAPNLQAGTKDGKLLASVSSSHHGKQILDLEKEPIPEASNQPFCSFICVPVFCSVYYYSYVSFSL